MKCGNTADMERQLITGELKHSTDKHFHLLSGGLGSIAVNGMCSLQYQESGLVYLHARFRDSHPHCLLDRESSEGWDLRTHHCQWPGNEALIKSGLIPRPWSVAWE